MTHREILRSAADIAESCGRHRTAEVLRCLAQRESPPAPVDTVAVRIAVAANQYGDSAACEIDNAIKEDAALNDVKMCCPGPSDVAILTANIPRRTIPVVDAGVEEVP